jgi:hypothetical protein
MHTNMETTHGLIGIMQKETEHLTLYLQEGQKLFVCIYERNWKQLEEVLKGLEPLAEAIMTADSERERVFQFLKDEVGAGRDDHFYQVVVRLPDYLRDMLAGAFREMKIAVFRLQALTTQIEGYVNSTTGTIREILEELFPHQKGTFYSKKGRTANPEANPMVISRQL